MDERASDLLLSISPENDPGSVRLSLRDLAGERLIAEATSVRPSDSAFERATSLLSQFPAVDVPPADQRSLAAGIGEWLLPEGLRSVLYDSLQRATGNRIRLWLSIDDPALGAIPWEAALLPDAPGFPNGEFLSLHPQISVIRRAANATQPIACTVERLRVLIVWADPGSLRSPVSTPGPYPGLLHIAEEVKGITAELKRTDSVEYREISGATPAAIQRAATETWHIVHFIGHAIVRPTGGKIVLEGAEPGAWVETPADYLAPLFASSGVRLVVLSACRTAAPMVGVADGLIQSGIAAAVATQLPFRDGCAAAFSSELYRSLAAGIPVDRATDAARRSIRHFGADWMAPVLLLSTTEPLLFRSETHSRKSGITARVPILSGPYFIGRESELSELQEALSVCSHAAITGMGGVGKSLLAAEFAHRNRSSYPGGVFWFDASSTDALESSLARSVDVTSGVEDEQPIRVRAEEALRILSDLTAPSLVVFDNLDMETDIALLQVGGQCKMLATSRRRDLDRRGYRSVALADFDLETSLDLLEARLDGKARSDFRRGRALEGKAATDEEVALVREVEAARELSESVGCLPLALDVIAHHVQHLGRKFTTYRRDRMSRPDEILPELERAFRHWSEKTRHPASVYTALHVQYASLDSCAQGVLCAAGWLAPSDFSIELLIHAGDEAGWRDREDAAATLKNLSLLTGGQHDRLRMHDLLRFFVQSLPAEERPGDARESIIRSLIRQMTEAHERGSYLAVRADLAHHEHIARAFENDPEPPAGFARLLLELGRYRSLHGERKAGIALMERALHHADGADSAIVLDILASLAESCDDASRDRPDEVEESGRYRARALECAGRLRTLLDSAIGVPTESLAHAHRSAGYVYRRRRQFDIARELYEKGLAIATARGGSTPEAAEFFNNLAILDEVAGDPAAAVARLEQALQIERKSRAPGHPQIAVCLNNLGRNLCRIGRYEEALACHLEAIEINVHAYSESHPYVAASRYFAGRVLEKLGQDSEALALYVPSHQVYLEARGPSGRMTRMVNRRLRALSLKSARQERAEHKTVHSGGAL